MKLTRETKPPIQADSFCPWFNPWADFLIILRYERLPLEKYLWISIGAVLGANLRYWLGGWIISRLGSGFPFGTLLINI